MLNLFAYADSDEEDVKTDSTSVSMKQTRDPKPEKESLFAALPKATKKKGKKQLNLTEIAKFAQVPVDELRKEFNEETNEKKENGSLVGMLPKPTNHIEEKSNTETIVDNHEEEDEVPVSSNGVIPLNPFLDDATTIQKEEKEKPVTYTTIYHVPQRKRDREENAGIDTTFSNETLSSYQESTPSVGYGNNFSQSQYEAFMRRSGMLATANAPTTSSANMLGEDAHYYDKQTKQALESGNVIELNQNDLHDHTAQPDSEYWERRKRKAAVAAQFGKYAHIAPTEVQQTRNQITYLASQAIEQLTDIDNRRAQQRKTRREVRAKYGW